MAFMNGSDYESTPLFEPDDEGRSRFRGVRPRRLRDPDPTLEHTVSGSERLDSVAWNYYGDARGWRLLMEANPDTLFPEDLLYVPREGEETEGSRLGGIILIGRKKELR